MYRLFAVTTLGLAFTLSLAAQTVNPTECTGYPERRAFLEAQSWWLQTPGQSGTDYGHVHLGTCFPVGETLRGTVRFDVRVILHHNSGEFYRLRIGTQSTLLYEDTSPDIRFTCATGTCERWFTVYLDTRKHKYDGRTEFRMSAFVKTPDAQTMFNSTGWLVNLNNGYKRSDYRRDWNFHEGRGWYSDAVGYTNARLLSSFPWAPVRGQWTVKIDLRPGSDGIPVTYHIATVDPHFHTGHEGIVVKQGEGPFVGYVTIDTTKLANGPHKLVLRADADHVTGSTNSGVMVIPFTVGN